MSYMLVIGYNPNQYSTGSTEPSRWLTLDVQSSKRVNASSTIAQHPIQTGDTISDHMYRNATTETVSGYFGILSGNREIKKTSTYGYGGNGIDKLTDVEETFEEIKNMGYLCKLITMDEDNASTFRFKIRDNMALTSITWEEMENVVKYDFDFKEAIVINKNDKYNPDIYSLSDLNLPNINALVGVSLAKTMASDVNFGGLVVKFLEANGYLSDQLIHDIAVQRTNYDVYGTLGLVSTAAGLTTVGLAAIGVISGGFLLPVLLLCGLGVYFGVKSVEAANRGNKVMKKIETLAELDEIYSKVNLKFLNMKSNATVYSFPKNDSCEAMIKVGSDYYIISAAKKSNKEVLTESLQSNYYFSVRNAKDGEGMLAYNPNINSIWNQYQRIEVEKVFAGYEDGDWSRPIYNSKYVACPSSPTNLAQLNFGTNGWFADSTGTYQVYLVNVYADDTICAEKAEKRKALRDLTNYNIIVFKDDPEVEFQKIINIIYDAIDGITED